MPHGDRGKKGAINTVSSAEVPVQA
jgi:hypothetical protein